MSSHPAPVQRQRYDLVLASADAPEREGPPARTLLVCTQQRSGSTLLGEAIYFARGLGCPLEYFHEGFRPAFQARWAPSDLGEYVKCLYRFRTDPDGVFSVKLFWRDIVDLVREASPGEFDALATAPASQTAEGAYRRVFRIASEFFPSPSFAFLTRRDELRQAVSLSVAAQTHSWRLFEDPEGAPSRGLAPFDFDQIVQALAEIQNANAHWTNFFRANELPYHPLTYEDLAGDYDRTLRTFLDAIGRPDAPITPPRLRKQGDALSEEILEAFVTEFRRRARG